MKHLSLSMRGVLLFAVAALAAILLSGAYLAFADGNSHSLLLDASQAEHAFIADGTPLNATSSVTVEAWVKLADPGASPFGTQTIVSLGKGTSDDPGPYLFQLKNNLLFAQMNDTSHTANAPWPGMDAGVWHHVAWVMDASNPGTTGSTLYADGAVLGQDNGLAGLNTSSQTFYLGTTKEFNDLVKHFDGQIDEVRIWSVARTEQQILDNMEVELTGNEPGLVAYWKFNNDLLATGSSNNLTASGTPEFLTNVPFPDPDTTPPTVSVTSPFEDQVLAQGTFPLEAAASDDVAVNGVQFLIDGSPYGTEDTTAPYSVDLNTASLSGSYTVAAVARDTSNNFATSTIVNFTVFGPDLSVRQNNLASTTSTTPLAGELTLQLEANKTYIVDGVIFAQSVSATPDLRVEFAGPAGSSHMMGLTTDVDNESLSGSTNGRFALQANIIKSVHVHGTVLIGGTSGAFELKTAQWVVNGNPVYILPGGYLRAEEL